MKRFVKRILPLAAALVFVAASVGAFDYASSGFTVVSEKKGDDGSVTTNLTDADGNAFSVTAETEPQAAQVERITTLVKQLNGLDSLKPETLRFRLSPNRIEIVLMPSLFAIDGVDYLSYVPAGLQFYFSTFLEYDFRLKVDNYFIRMQGNFFDEGEFDKRIASAVHDPVAFIQTNDPGYIIRKLNELDMAQQANIAKQRDTDAKLAAVDARDSDQETRLAAIDAKDANQDSSLSADGDRMTADETKLERLQSALAAYLNKPFFGSAKQIPPEVIKALVAQKTAKPELTRKDALDALKAQGLPQDAKAVDIVFMVYFNDFGK
jgi:hypothetical protein